MSKLEELIQELCPDGVRFKSIKEVYQRVKGTPITAGKMKEIENNKGDIRVFAGGKALVLPVLHKAAVVGEHFFDDLMGGHGGFLSFKQKKRPAGRCPQPGRGFDGERAA